ncbi:MAG: DUF3987 domain-containing protein [Bacteroidetes bacterium]|nr:DUF3987 domain-containing protein [Bacteroidota bacterium]
MVVKINSNEINIQNKLSDDNFNSFVSIINDNSEGWTLGYENEWSYMFFILCNKLGLSKEEAGNFYLKQVKEHMELDNYLTYLQRGEELMEIVYSQYSIEHNDWEYQWREGDNVEVTFDMGNIARINDGLEHSNSNREIEKNDSLYLPDWIFDKLPRFLKNAVKLYKYRHEKDMILLSSITTLSGFFPNYYGKYDRRKYSANIYLLILAPAGSGKGCIGVVRNLGKDVQKMLSDRYESDLKLYDEKKKELEADDADLNDLPPKPVPKTLFIPANITSAKMIECLFRNGNFGITIDTEADTFSQSLKSKYGGFSDILRKAFQNEAIDIARKTGDENYIVYRTCLSVLLTGTPNQLDNLLDNVGNGLDTRFLYYDYSGDSEWRDVFEEYDSLPEVAFNGMSAELADFVEKLKCFEEGSEIEFILSDSQKETFNQWFSKKHEELKETYGNDITGSVRRLGLIAWRIAMTLSIIRKIDSPLDFNTVICKDMDFEISLAIIDRLLPHTTRIFTSLRTDTSKACNVKKADLYWEKLPANFDRVEALKIASQLSINDKTSGNYLTGFIAEGILKRVSHGVYAKIV